MAVLKATAAVGMISLRRQWINIHKAVTVRHNLSQTTMQTDILNINKDIRNRLNMIKASNIRKITSE